MIQSLAALIAVQFIVQDPCSVTPWLDVAAEATVGDSVGTATVATLGRHAIPFVGNAQGIHSIRGTVTGDAAIEVLSDTEMRAYGWCYRINGVEPDTLPHEVRIQNDSDVIYWVFGYAHYRGGEWISYCTPTHDERPPYICD